MTHLTGNAAIEFAAQHGLSLAKHADPTEGARDGLTVEQAREVAREDASLIYLDVAPRAGDRVEAGEGEDYDTGSVLEVSGDKALVGWDTQVQTWTPVGDLAVTGRL